MEILWSMLQMPLWFAQRLLPAPLPNLHHVSAMVTEDFPEIRMPLPSLFCAFLASSFDRLRVADA